MEEFDRILSEAEREGIKMSQGLSRMLLTMWRSASDELKAAKESSKRLRLVAIVATILSVVCLCCCVYMGTVLHKQDGEIKAIHQILDEGVVIEETITTTTEEITTQTVEGDSATINNGSWEQYNDNAVNGGGE